jgi:protein-S-isoprenylcysteine O-methyltransferase Ste14
MAVGAIVLGIWLRQNPSKENAERSSRVMHFLFFAGQIAPPIVAFFYPGISRFDELVGLNPLPMRPVFLGIGILFAIPGFYFMAVTNKLLRAIGNGTNAFVLTKHVVNADIYKRTRNPMSLGFYLLAIALGLVTGSTFATLAAVLGIIPSHLIFIKYFEEKELELRFGETYLEYKKTVPFLIPKFGS